VFERRKYFDSYNVDANIVDLRLLARRISGLTSSSLIAFGL
ncbi:unnamed protein product, partial [Acidithrix sp. C25]